MNNTDPPTAPREWGEKVVYKTNTLYALTVNPNDRHQYIDKKTWSERYKSCHSYMVRLFQDACINQTYFYLWEELSEVTNSKMSRYHVHGLIKFETEDAIKYWLLQMTINLMATQWELKPITELDVWLAYCKKQGLLSHVTNVFDLDEFTTPPAESCPIQETEKPRKRTRRSSRKMKIAK